MFNLLPHTLLFRNTVDPLASSLLQDTNLSVIPITYSIVIHTCVIQKYRGFPNVTCAPGYKKENEMVTRKLAFMKEPSLGASHLDHLSDSVMDGTALNDLCELQQNTGENMHSNLQLYICNS